MSHEVAVVIPAHNSAATLERAVNSVLAQTLPPTEIVIVNDGSSDSTGTIAERIAEGNDTIRVIHRREPSGGPATPRNLGIEATTSPWVAFLDSDDEWLPEKLARQSAYFDSPYDVVYTHTLVQTREGWRQWNLPALQAPATLPQLATANCIRLLTALVRRERLVRTGGFDPCAERVSVEDWHLWLRIAHGGGGFHLVPEPLARYYRSVGSLTSHFERHLRAQRLMFQSLVVAYPDSRDLQTALRNMKVHLTSQRVRAIMDPMTPLPSVPICVVRAILGDPSLRTARTCLKSVLVRTKGGMTSDRAV